MEAVEALLPLSDAQWEGIITVRAEKTWTNLPQQQRALPAARDLRERLVASTTKETEN